MSLLGKRADDAIRRHFTAVPAPEGKLSTYYKCNHCSKECSSSSATRLRKHLDKCYEFRTSEPHEAEAISTLVADAEERPLKRQRLLTQGYGAIHSRTAAEYEDLTNEATFALLAGGNAFMLLEGPGWNEFFTTASPGWAPPTKNVVTRRLSNPSSGTATLLISSIDRKEL